MSIGFKSIKYQLLIPFIGCKSVGEQVIQMREAMRQLPPAHFNCLKFMIEHLNRYVLILFYFQFLVFACLFHLPQKKTFIFRCSYDKHLIIDW